MVQVEKLKNLILTQIRFKAQALYTTVEYNKGSVM
jgi:hypothetical protein